MFDLSVLDKCKCKCDLLETDSASPSQVRQCPNSISWHGNVVYTIYIEHAGSGYLEIYINVHTVIGSEER